MKQIILTCLILILTISLSAQDKNDPPWVIYQKARTYASQAEYGHAIEYYKEALTLRPHYPEAEMAIADIYWQIEGEYILAERHYKKALAEKNYFEIPNQKYQVMEKLGDLYLNWMRYFDYQHILLNIITEDSEYYEKEFMTFSEAYYKLYMDKGFNQLFRLFRVKAYPHVIKAHRELGWFLYRSGQYKGAVTHLLFSLVNMLSESFDYLLQFKPLYEFTDLKTYIKVLYENKDIAQFLEDQNFFKALYYLGAASYALGKHNFSHDIYNIIVDSHYRGNYYNEARKQLRKPFIEEVLYIKEDSNDLNLDSLVN